MAPRCHDSLVTDETDPEEPHPTQRPTQPPAGGAVDSDDGGTRAAGPIAQLPAGMTVREARAAAADPEHPHHAAAKAVEQRWATNALKIGAGSAYGESIRRIGENLAAALETSTLLAAPTLGATLPTWPEVALKVPRVDDLHVADLPVNETPGKTLEALVEVSELMSEMVRLSAEHRDAAVQQMKQYERDSRGTKVRDLWMFGVTCVAVIGTWVAVFVAVKSR